MSSLLLGVATGLLWAPCAGPVLGLILTGAALQGASVGPRCCSSPMPPARRLRWHWRLLVGGRVFAAMKRSLPAGEWVRRGLGVAVLVAVVAIALGLDTGFLTRISLASTASLEQGLLDRLHVSDRLARTDIRRAREWAGDDGRQSAMMPRRRGRKPRSWRSRTSQPSFAGAVEWLNSPPLTAEGLKGKVVLVDFWTYSCINCLRAIPYVRAWAEKYKDQGLVVIGVHTPEFAFEQNVGNVQPAIADLHDHLSRRHRQRLCDLARVRKPVLAGALLHRCARPRPPPPFRRRRLRSFRTGDPAAAGGSRQVQRIGGAASR